MSLDEEIRAIFRDEAEQLLGRMARRALALEESGPDAAHIDQLFRDAHTVKGSAALTGFTATAGVAHVLEDVLGDLRSGRRELDPALVDVLLRGVDDLREVLALEAAGGDAAPASRRSVARLEGDPPAPPGQEPPPAAPDGPVQEPPGEGGGPPVEEPPDDAGGPPVQEPPPTTPPPGRGEAPVQEPPTTHPARAAADGGDAVRVPLARLDRLVRLAGEAVAAQLRLRHLLGDAIAADPDAGATAARLERTLRTLQEQTLRARMTTLGAVAEPLRRVARDVARAEGKQVRYEHDGERAELDRGILDALRDPLLHLVRNAVGHGLEAPAARTAAGKPAAGTVAVRGRRAGGEVVIEVADDGRGLDLDALRAKAGRDDLDDLRAAELVFEPGLSTAAAVSDVSGRGVGLDAVRAAVRGLRGDVEVESRPGAGCTFRLRVPMSLAVVPCLLVRSGTERYALPAHAAHTIIDAADETRVALEGGAAVWVAGDVVPLRRLAAVLGRDAAGGRRGPAVVLTGAGGRRHALAVDELLGQRSLTVQDLGRVLPRLDVVAGAAIEPDGEVVLVLDAAALVARAQGGHGAAAPVPVPAAPAAARILVVDDAMTVRELQRAILGRAGYDVRTAVDGEEALAQIARERPELVITDIEMPRLDGFALLAAIRARPELQGLPVLVVSSRADEADRRRALELGADRYLVKRDFDGPGLLGAVGELLGDAG